MRREYGSDLSQITMLNVDNIQRLFGVDEYRRYDDIVMITHPGIFHADDVCACAVLSYAVKEWQAPNCKLHVIRKTPAHGETWEQMARDAVGVSGHFSAAIVFDIGKGDFDHHQGIERRENGVPYAAFGKIWRAVGSALVGKEAAQVFDEEIVQPIDNGDNGESRNPLSALISAQNPFWDSTADDDMRDAAFESTVEMILPLFIRWFARAASAERAAEAVRKEYKTRAESGKDTRILPMRQFTPVGRVLVDEFPEVVFTITPSLRGGVNLQGVAKVPGEFGNKMDLPEEWLTTPPKGCTFVHQGRFLAAFETAEAAETAAQQFLQENAERA